MVGVTGLKRKVWLELWGLNTNNSFGEPGYESTRHVLRLVGTKDVPTLTLFTEQHVYQNIKPVVLQLLCLRISVQVDDKYYTWEG